MHKKEHFRNKISTNHRQTEYFQLCYINLVGSLISYCPLWWGKKESKKEEGKEGEKDREREGDRGKDEGKEEPKQKKQQLFSFAIENAKARMCWLEEQNEASSGDTGEEKNRVDFAQELFSLEPAMQETVCIQHSVIWTQNRLPPSQ